MTATTRIAASDQWETVENCHHFYTEADCHDGAFTTSMLDGKRTFCGAVGRYRWQATVTLDVPYCSSCDEPLPSNGVCDRCQVIHADIAKGLGEPRSELKQPGGWVR